MSESSKFYTLHEVREFVYGDSSFRVTIKVLKSIAGNAKAPYTCYLSSMDVMVTNKDFIFFGETEEEVLEKMVEKLKVTYDLKAVLSQEPKNTLAAQK